MTATIKVYPSALPGEPIEAHVVDGGTLHDWLTMNCQSYESSSEYQPVSVFVDGAQIAPSEWDSLQCDDIDIEIRPIARAGVGAFIAAYGWYIAAAAVLIYVATMNRGMPKGMNGQQGESLSEASLEANTPKPNGIIPEIAGRHRIYPDYLVQPRRWFTSPTKQALEVLLCVGRGDFAINASDIRIGETRINDLTDVAEYEIFQPGADVSANPAHRNWYNVPEVGSTRGSSGLRLTAGTSGTPFASATSYVVDGNSISIPAGAGIAPQDWEVGGLVSIVARIRTVEIVDGGGTYFNRNRDYVRGSFGDLALAVGDVLLIYGISDGQYRVNTITTSVSVAGTPSSITAVKVSPLAFLASPVTFQIGAFDVILDQDYADADALVADINSQIGGIVASHTGGVIKLTESSPFSGTNIYIGGYYEPVFGAAPTYTTGTATQSYDELTLDKWTAEVNATGETVYSWQKAASLPTGIWADVEVQKARNRSGFYSATEYRITSIITGTILDGSGSPVTANIGWTFQRLKPDGSDDPAWSGFVADVETPNVRIEFDQSQVVGGWLGPFKATPRNEKTGSIEFDVFAPQGIGYMNDDGGIDGRTKTWELQWRSSGGAWASQSFSVSAASRDQLGYTYAITLPSQLENVEVRLRRVGVEQTDVKNMDRLEWYGLRSLLSAPSSYAGVTTMAVKIAGSDSIGSSTENQINIVATRKLGGVATRSIEAWVRHVCADIGYSIADIDTDELARVGAIWDARQDYFDFVVGDQTTVREVISDALKAGYAELTIDDGRIRPVRDEPRSTFEHLYTPQNMTSALSRQFISYDPDDYDGVDVEYIDAQTWVKEIVECRLPGDIGLRVRKIEADGITDRTKAWRLGMRQRRIDAYRRKTYSFSTEWDALNSRYLSFCALSDDVPGYGQSAILISATLVSGGYLLRVSEPLNWDDAASHVIGLRRPDGTLCGPFPATRIDDFTAEIAGSLDFDPVTQASATEPTHAIFGSTTTWSYPALVTEITPSGDTVEVTAVNYDARIYMDDDNSPPV